MAAPNHATSSGYATTLNSKIWFMTSIAVLERPLSDKNYYFKYIRILFNIYMKYLFKLKWNIID
jgi:hypothetical protein